MHGGLAKQIPFGIDSGMFTVEHDFDATVVTLVDEGSQHLQEDVVINSFAECVTVEQYDPRQDKLVRITLSITQMKDLIAAVNLPEGVYRRAADARDES